MGSRLPILLLGLMLTASVSFAIQDASPVPDPCPLEVEGEGEGEGEPVIEGGGMSSVVRFVRLLVPLLAAGVVIALARKRVSKERATALLAVCAVLVVGTYAFLDRPVPGRFVNGYEFFHYYLGSKYAEELGYTELYAAALIADEETGRKFSHERDAVRDLDNNGCISVDRLLQDREAVLARFSPERWAEFSADVEYFKANLSESRWNGVFRDKGYNPTPVWTMIASPFTTRVPTSSPLGMLGLSLLDPLLLAIAVIVVWRTFGMRTALLMVVLIGTHMTMSHSHMKGALLRTEWVVSLVLAVCAVKAQRPVVGGMFLAMSAATRVFPGLFAVGLLAVPLLAFVRGRAPRPSQLRFGAAFTVSLVALVIVSALVGAPGAWEGFADKIWQHHDSFSPWRVGFKHLFLGAYDYRPDGLGTHQEAFHDRRVLWWAMQALLVGGLVFLIRRMKDWEILALGFLPVFLLTAPTYYYFIMLVVPLLYFSGRMPRAESAAGIAWLLVSSNIAYGIEGAVGRELPLFFALSLMFAAVCLQMSWSSGFELRRRHVSG